MARVSQVTGGVANLIVWVPKVGAEHEDAVDLSEEYPQPTTSHWWDAEGQAMDGFQAALGIPERAWDVYLIYPAGVRWTAADPPAPAFWMHQLGPPGEPRVDGPFLDAAEFGRRLKAGAGATAPN